MKTKFTSDWKNWIKTNVEAGRDQDGIFKILLDEGYIADAISQQMNYIPTHPLWKLKNPFEVAAAEKARTAKLKSNTKHERAQQHFTGNAGMPLKNQTSISPML